MKLPGAIPRKLLQLKYFNSGNIPTEGRVVLSNLENMTFVDCECDYEEFDDNIVIHTSTIAPLKSKKFPCEGFVCGRRTSWRKSAC